MLNISSTISRLACRLVYIFCDTNVILYIDTLSAEFSGRGQPLRMRKKRSKQDVHWRSSPPVD